MPRSGSRRALPSELSGIRDLCKLPQDKHEANAVINFLRDNRFYISMIAACASEIRHRLAPEPVCVMLDIIGGKPVITVSAEAEDVDVQSVLEDFFEEYYDPASIDVGCIRFIAEDNWASTRITRGELAPLP